MRPKLTAFIIAAMALGMLGVSFASKPLYDAFCRVTGFGGTTQVASAAPTQVLDRGVKVRLDSNIGQGTPLKFKAIDRLFDIRLGETGIAFFEVENPTDKSVRAIASYNVAPHKAGPYFNKLECFCFEERVFEPGEVSRLPVIFYIDPAMDEKRQLKDITEITLSYTFYDTQKDNENQIAQLEQAVIAQ